MNFTFQGPNTDYNMPLIEELPDNYTGPDDVRESISKRVGIQDVTELTTTKTTEITETRSASKSNDNQSFSENETETDNAPKVEEQVQIAGDTNGNVEGNETCSYFKLQYNY